MTHEKRNERIACLWQHGQTAREIAVELRISEPAVTHAIGSMRERGVELDRRGQGTRLYRPEEDAYLAANYLRVSDALMGVKLGRSEDSICNRRNKLGLLRRGLVPRKSNNGANAPAQPVPARPRGLCPQSVEWAKANPDHLEGALINLMVESGARVAA